LLKLHGDYIGGLQKMQLQQTPINTPDCDVRTYSVASWLSVYDLLHARDATATAAAVAGPARPHPGTLPASALLSLSITLTTQCL